MKFLALSCLMATAYAVPMDTPHWAIKAAPLQDTEVTDVSMVHFGKYPGYAGTLATAGKVDITFKTTHATFNYTLTGVDTTCTSPKAGTPNSCGIHIHEGVSCADASKVGGHYYNANELEYDPWQETVYTVVNGKADGLVRTEYGYDSHHTFGKVLVLHDREGAKFSCTVIFPNPQVHVEGFNPYPGYTGNFFPRGELYMSFTNRETQIFYNLNDVDSRCADGPKAGTKDSCGVIIHEGTCDEASTVGGNYFLAPAFDTDPWQTAGISAPKGAASGMVTVQYGYNIKQTDNKVVVLHDYNGVGITCDDVMLPEAPPVCSPETFCCPETKQCLTPSKKSCVTDPSVCGLGTTCCPITKTCVGVGDVCIPAGICPATSYCCPDARHCLTPVKAGYFCKVDTDCKGAGEVCCPLNKVCVTVGDRCTPPQVPQPVCNGASEFCCPEALRCLTPTKTSCAADANACTKGEVCCPLTKTCVVVGVECVPPPVCADNEICCPDTLHCLRPTNPGSFCENDKSCTGLGEVCCPLTKMCVTVGKECELPVDPPPFPPPKVPVCKDTEYCCPDSNKCLTTVEPKKSCALSDTACGSGEQCCPLTKLCTNVGVYCEPPAICPLTSYCCPDSLHCLTPSANPDNAPLCDLDTDCRGTGEVCCPLNKICVTVGDVCTPS